MPKLLHAPTTLQEFLCGTSFTFVTCLSFVGFINCRTHLVVDVCYLLHKYQLHVSALKAVFRLNELTKT